MTYKLTAVNHLHITAGPSVADPADFVRVAAVNADGSFKQFHVMGWKNAWKRFLVWAIRKTFLDKSA